MAKVFKTIKYRLERQPVLVAGVLVGAAAVLVIGVGTIMASAVHAEDPLSIVNKTISDLHGGASQNADAAEIDHFDARAACDEAHTALDAASGTEDVNLFSSTAGSERTLSDDAIADVRGAIAAYRDAGYDVGFVLYDFAAHQGMGYNADEQFFSASTVKAPYVAFVAQDMVDGGKASFDDEVVKDLIVDGTGIMSADNKDIYDLQTVMDNTIEHSDNTGYGLLRERFNVADFDAWCAAADVNTTGWAGEWYPYYTPRDLAKMWLNIGEYLAEGEGAAPWLAATLQRTQSSFLREALGDQHTVLSKPGYEIDTATYDMGSLNDAGLVVLGTDTYVIAIMSDADYDDEYFTDNDYLITDLASALNSAHDRLLHEGGAA